jgi:hypothetical protein
MVPVDAAAEIRGVETEAGLPRRVTPVGGPGTRVGNYMQALHVNTRQTTQTAWGAACEG